MWLLLPLVLQGPPSLPAPWRVVEEQGLHVGVRPAAVLSTYETAFGATLQISWLP
jgi:hypothetical protein